MNKWRPKDWDEIIHLHPADDEWMHGYYNGVEVGADAMLEALFKLARESPTKTFTIDSKVIICAFMGEE